MFVFSSVFGCARGKNYFESLSQISEKTIFQDCFRDFVQKVPRRRKFLFLKSILTDFGQDSLS